MRNKIEFGACSDIGCVREGNEDSFGAAPDVRLFVLSDGMGGLAFGEVASRIAVETIIREYRGAKAGTGLNGDSIEGVSEASNRLVSAIHAANKAIYQNAEQNGANQQMGATVVAVHLAEERMSLAHVGDSRAYRLRGGQLEQLTRDHSFIAEQVRQGRMTQLEAGRSGLQNVLLRALGTSPKVDVEITEELILDGDIVLLCSDGLTRELTDARIAAILGSCDEAQEAADRLVEAAKQAGGGDNITAIVLRRDANSRNSFARMFRIGR
ncbi:MAG: serine/threonine-protein phosphatase [Acidobacteriota bacterium]|nr:serine/threonine-protein phosphatase [Acidobacteriota bacterium]